MRPTKSYHPVDDDDPPDARPRKLVAPYPTAGPSAAELEEARAIIDGNEVVRPRTRPPRGHANSNSTTERPAPMSRR